MLGDAIDACMGNGTVCDPIATSNVLCNMMGEFHLFWGGGGLGFGGWAGVGVGPVLLL